MAYTEQEMQQFVAQYGPLVYRLAMAQLRHTADAEDVYQDVFLKLIRHQPEFQNPAHQKAWFIRVTVNTCKDRLKKASRRDLPLEEATASAAVPEQTGLEDALARLSERDRALIYLYYYEGYKTEEIATILQVGGSTVRSRLKRARARLKDFMTEGEDDLV